MDRLLPTLRFSISATRAFLHCRDILVSNGVTTTFAQVTTLQSRATEFLHRAMILR